jgi:hypothetical protein
VFWALAILPSAHRAEAQNSMTSFTAPLRRRLPRSLFCVSTLPLGLVVSAAIAIAATHDPVSSAILTKATSALGASAITGIAMTGVVTYSAGSDQDSGPIQMQAIGLFDAAVYMNLSSGKRAEISHRDTGAWAGPDGVSHSIPFHNSLTIPGWFSPSLIVHACLTDKSFLASNIGTEERNGISVEHIRCSRRFEQNGASTAGLLSGVAMELFLDHATSLPVACEFNTHPDNNELLNIPVRIEFSDYQTAGTSRAPFRIQKYLQNTLLLDISVSAVTLNPTLPSTDFSLQ